MKTVHPTSEASIFSKMPWQGGKKQISLLCMTKYCATYLSTAAQALEVCRMCASEGMIPQLKEYLLEFKKWADHIGVKHTQPAIQRLFDACNADPSQEYHTATEEIQSRWDDELESIQFLYLNPDESARYDNATDGFGDAVNMAFPSAKYDCSEAQRALALGLNTAAVLHSMRALEFALRSLSHALNVPFTESTWNKILVDLESKWKRNEALPKKPRGWKKDRQFYNEAFVEFRHFKDAWRNYAMHAHTMYSQQDAVKILSHAADFMRHLAGRLKERR